MAHSPLKMFKLFHDKRVLVSGQGPIREISKNLGFTNVCTVEDIRKAFPVLDVVDQKKRENMVIKIYLLDRTINLEILYSVKKNRREIPAYRSCCSNAGTS